MWRDQVQEIVGIKINEWQGAKIIALWEQGNNSAPKEERSKAENNNEAKVETQPIHVREKIFRSLCNKAAYAIACRLEASHPNLKK